MDYVEKVKEIDQQIIKLDKILKSGEHAAAGIEVQLHVGVRHDDDLPDLVMEFGIFSDVDGLVKKMRECLVEARAAWLRRAREQAAKLNAFLASET